MNLTVKPITILVAPDKFKGSLTSGEVCHVIANALENELPGVNIISLPLADGGEGSCELLTSTVHGSYREVEVHDPLLRKIKAKFGLSADGTTAFIEMAAASGLQLLSDAERNPLKTTSFGTGEMIRKALDLGVTKIVLGIGGSSTNDGGMGTAQALGLQVFNSKGEEIMVTGEKLKEIFDIRRDNIHPALKRISFTLLCDVDNPLYGPRGAAQVFAPQKGASPAEVILLDDGLRHLEKILVNQLGADLDFPGVGAGGGFAVGLAALAHVALVPGMHYIAGFTRLEEKIMQADVIITGEGHLDEQTLSGKVVKGVADLARKHHKPVLVIAGKNSLTPEKVSAAGISKVLTLQSDSVTATEAIREAATTLRKLLLHDVVAWLKER